MRTCIVFRGENFRHKRGVTSALECLDNWKETILDVIPCDVAFFTYPSGILDELVEKMSPVHVCTSGYGCQDSNSRAAINWMVEKKDNYDRFLLVRFDIMYRKRVVDWPHWEKKGISLTNRDVHYPSRRLYQDLVFVVDREWIGQFCDAFVAEGKSRVCLHHIGQYLEEMPDVPLHLMYSGYYHMTKHPLFAVHPSEDRPSTNNNYQGEEIIDISPWNPGFVAAPS